LSANNRIRALDLKRAWAEIDLDCIHSNLIKITRIVGGVRVLAVIKSDAYGHGAPAVARELEAAGAAFFGTATASEACRLRDAGIKNPLLVLSGMTAEELPLLMDYDVIPAVYTREFLKAISEFARKNNKRLKIHIKVDTGMGRLGFSISDAVQALQNPMPYLIVDGVFTHFANADRPNDEYTRSQIGAFTEFIRLHVSAIPQIHAANSSAILHYPTSYFNLVRPGLLLYGISPNPGPSDFLPALTLKSRIIFLQHVRKGAAIGYGLTFRAERDSLIATAPFGYSDGLRRALSNKLEVEVHGKMCKIAGTISMDLCMIDVTDLANQVQIGDVITFLGPRTTAWHWAALLDTVPYEIVCLIGGRVPRVYYKGGKIQDIYYP